MRPQTLGPQENPDREPDPMQQWLHFARKLKEHQSVIFDGPYISRIKRFVPEKERERG